MKCSKLVSFLFTALPVLSIQAFELESTDVTNDKSLRKAQVFNQWGCTGENKSPQLNWSAVPKETKSFAVTMYDPDAPTGSGWWHWLVVNIPSDQTGLAENAGAQGGQRLPKGASMVTNDFGYKGFGGACPPPNAAPHNYQITVYALNTDKIDLPEHASGALAGYNILQHVIDKAVLTAPTNMR